MAAPCPGGWPSPQQGHCATCCPYAHTQQKEPEGPVSCLPGSPATISSRGVPAPYPGNVCKCFFLMGDHVGPPGAPSPSIPTLVPVHVACKSFPVFGRAVLPLSTPTPPNISGHALVWPWHIHVGLCARRLLRRLHVRLGTAPTQCSVHWREGLAHTRAQAPLPVLHGRVLSKHSLLGS